MGKYGNVWNYEINLNTLSSSAAEKDVLRACRPPSPAQQPKPDEPKGVCLQRSHSGAARIDTSKTRPARPMTRKDREKEDRKRRMAGVRLHLPRKRKKTTRALEEGDGGSHLQVPPSPDGTHTSSLHSGSASASVEDEEVKARVRAEKALYLQRYLQPRPELTKDSEWQEAHPAKTGTTTPLESSGGGGEEGRKDGESSPLRVVYRPKRKNGKGECPMGRPNAGSSDSAAAGNDDGGGGGNDRSSKGIDINRGVARAKTKKTKKKKKKSCLLSFSHEEDE